MFCIVCYYVLYCILLCFVLYFIMFCIVFYCVLYCILLCIVLYLIVYCIVSYCVLCLYLICYLYTIVLTKVTTNKEIYIAQRESVQINYCLFISVLFVGDPIIKEEDLAINNWPFVFNCLR